ncbi:MAG: ABC transporter permease [Halieaceae bacterium]|jgi:capsular polysaccharide transport system permease protein|nr:ABC transporter permease [Halieaceae bacterium]
MRNDHVVAMQGRVLFALMMREMSTRYGRNAGGYVWAVLEPAGTIAIMSAIFQFIARQPALGTNFPIFFATGYLAFHFYLDISRTVSNAVNSNRALLVLPRITVIDTVIARFFLQLITLSFVSVLIMGGLLIVFDEPVIIRFHHIIISILLSSFLGLSIGVFNCIAFAYSATWQSIFMILNRPIFLISGIFFLYESLPRFVQDILWWNPLIHVTSIMRVGFYPTYEGSFASPVYVVIFASIPFMIGVMLMRLMRNTLLEP